MNRLSKVYFNIKSHKLSYQTLIYIVLCSSIFTLVATLIQLYFDYKRDIATIHSNLQFIEDNYVKVIATNLYEINNEQIKILLESALKLQDVEYLEIRETWGKKEYRIFKGKPVKKKSLVRTFPLKYQMKNGKIISIGTFSVVASLEGVFQRLWEKFLMVLTINALKLFFASFCIFLIIQFLITRHLYTIADHMKQLNFNKLEGLLSLKRKIPNQPDELEEVVSSINNIMNRLVKDNLEQKKSKEELAKTQALMLAAIEQTPTGVIIADAPEVKIRIANSTALNIRGETLKSLTDIPLELHPERWQVYYPDGSLLKAEDLPLSKAILRGKTTKNAELFIRQNNGEIRWILSNAAPVYNPDGEIMAGIVVFSDVTERKKNEVALADSHERFLAVLDSIDIHVYVTEINTFEILLMNKYMKKSFGADFTGQICWEAFQDGSEPCDHCENEKLFDDKGKPAGVNICEVQNPITKKYYINYSRAIKWVDGRYVRLQVAMDITRIKELEEKRLKTEAQLRQAQKMEAIGTLAGGIAHDFNNILFPIVGFVEMLVEDIDKNSPHQESLKEILTAAKRAKDLVRQILTFSRQAEHELKPLSIQISIKEVLKLMRSSLPSTIVIDQNIGDDYDPVMADPSQIHQIAMNLFTNAYHAMQNFGGKLGVTLSQVDLTADDLKRTELASGQYICLEVSDTGIGMDGAVMDRIFEPYFTTKEKGKGTGLGLSVVHGIVKSYGGFINVESELGKGTVFKIYLPVLRTEAEIEEIKDDNLPIQRGDEKILLVDDEEQIARMEKKLIERLGYEITMRTSSLEALEVFRSNPKQFDLVITDMTMPNMTGIEFSQKLMKVNPEIPIIICTGFSEQINEEKARKFGIRGFVMKPVVKSKMAKTIRDALDA